MKVISPNNSEKKIYRCRICGYIYDSSKGELLHRIPAGVDFLDLPDSWRCPICKYPKREFREVNLYLQGQT